MNWTDQEGLGNAGGLLAEFSAREQFGGDRQAIHSSVSSVVERMGGNICESTIEK